MARVVSVQISAISARLMSPIATNANHCIASIFTRLPATRTIAGGAPGMPAYGAQFTPQQLWQLSGYVKSLPKTKPNMRRRNSAAQQGEPSGATWQGALR